MRSAFVFAALAAISLGGQTQAATTVLGNGLAGICSQAAKAGEDNQPALEVCTMALETESMNRRDRAGTYVNRGGALVGQKRYMEALLEIDKGLALGPEEPEKAYYNRALANEGLDDIKAAYFDYRRAVELAPEWDIPKRELLRFSVARP